MIIMKKKLFFSAIILASCVLMNGQDIHFSLFNFAPLSLNPAQAGVQSDVRAIANYRDQWSSIGNGYKTMGVSCDLSTLKKADRPAWLGVGVNIFNDKAGDGQLSTFLTNLSLAGVVPSGKNTYSAGIQLGYYQKSVNTSDFKWDSQFDGFKYDANLSTQEYYNNPSFNFFTVGGGFNWYYSKTEHYMTANDELKINMGVSAFHFNGPRQSFKDLTDEKLYSKIVLYGNYSIGIHNKKFCLMPSFMVCLQGPSKQINVGNLFKFIITEASHFTHIKKACALSLGGFYRAGDAFIGQALLEYDRYALGLAYDMNTSRLKTASKSFGGFEVSFRWHSFKAAGSSKARI